MKQVLSHAASARLAVPTLALVAAAGLCIPAANLQADPVDWVNPGTGFWNTGANWSTGAFPNSQTVLARILNGGTAEINGTFSVGGLHVGNGSGVRLLNGNTFSLYGNVDNDGFLEIAGAGNNTVLNIQNNLSFAGSGEVRFVGGTSTTVSRITGSFSSNHTLTNAAGHTIRALDFANLGFNTININNQGLIVADGSGTSAGEFVVNGRSSSDVTVTNTGTMRAENAGTLTLSGSGGGRLDNTDGIIEALDASTVRLISGANITGGTLQSQGSGQFQVSGSAAISDLTNDSNFRILNNATLTAAGTIDNLGSITLDNTGNNTVMTLGGDLTLTGPGEVRYVGGASTTVNRITGNFSADSTLTNDAGHTIRAFDFANLGFGAINIDNQGLIVADGSGATPGELIVNGRSSSGVTVTNTGTMRAENGGTLTLSGSGGGQFDNTDGIIEATSGGTIARISNPTIVNFDAPAHTLTGGAWVANNGTLNVAPTNFDLEISHADVTIRGTGAQTNLFDTATSAAGDIRSLRFRENHGEFTVADGANFTTTLTGFDALENSGTIVIGDASSLHVLGDADILRGLPASLLRGSGTLHAHLDTDGDVRVDGLATLAIEGHTFIGGEFAIDLGATAGLLQVNGDLDLIGTLDVHVLETDFTQDGAEFIIATTTGALTGEFTSITTNNPLYEFEAFFDIEAGHVVLRAAVIPAPTSIALLTLAGIAASRRRR